MHWKRTNTMCALDRTRYCFLPNTLERNDFFSSAPRLLISHSKPSKLATATASLSGFLWSGSNMMPSL